MTNKLVVTGIIVAEPEFRQAGNSNLLTFPVYDSERRKNQDTGEYENVDGSALKVKVNFWGERADEYNGQFNKGDLVELTARVTQRDYEENGKKRTGGVETVWVESIEVKSRGGGQTEAGF